ncbi:hypothetical protein ACP4OV_002271 [Aristida adscensionis]
MAAAAAAAAALPDELLADILGRLPARGLAASRCVCRAWRDLVDGRRLLLPRLLPRAVRGFFASYVGHDRSHFLAHPALAAAAAGPRVDGRFDYVDPTESFGSSRVVDHCNGLVLLLSDGDGGLCACNPATRRAARLPPLDAAGDDRWRRRALLAFDPSAAPRRYEVLLSPPEPGRKERDRDDGGARRRKEWPPWPWRWLAFSSWTGEWRERAFRREGEAAGSVADVAVDELPPHGWKAVWRYAAYWRGALYVHCRGEYVSRLESGVHFVTIHWRRLRVWILDEQQNQSEWVIKHDNVLNPADWWSYQHENREDKDGPWIMEDYYGRAKKEDAEWNSDDDDIIGTAERIEDDVEDLASYDLYVLGFHPCKEVIYLTTMDVAVAYHLNSSKVQYLGMLTPNAMNHGVHDSFVYTPLLRPI